MKWIRVHYLDASAIVKLFVDEVGSDELRMYFNKESHFSTTSICFAEALGVLKSMRFYRKEPITDEQYFCACEDLLGYASDNTIKIEDVEIKDINVFVKVENLVRKHNGGKPKDKTIDISDAFQIISVKRNYFSQFDNDSKPILITGDRSLAEAARSEGLRVWNCVDEPTPQELTEA
jgi:predicted nucleic acid-binding protein